MKANQTGFCGSRSSGFTLMELMIALTILGVLLTLAIPSVRDLNLGANTVSKSNCLLGKLNSARAEAVKNANNVRVSATGGIWNNGLTVATDRNMNGAIDVGDGDILLQQGCEASTGFDWTAVTQPGGAAVTQLFYTPTGALSTPAAGVWFKLVRPDRASFPERCKRVLVVASGRAEANKGSIAQCAAA